MEHEVGSSRKSEDSLSEFTLAEIVEMENIYNEVGKECLLPQFCQGLATSFSYSLARAGNSVITWEQVLSWFQNKHKENKAKAASSPVALKLFVDLSDQTLPTNVPESSQKPKGSILSEGKAADLHELAFEAKSAKDNAWYDVTSFLNYRILSTGELEVRVRFAGFNNTEDEWVNVHKAVRERSIPLEPFECQRVKIGDLVLCFQERQDQAVYCDAHVVEIQRRLHDIRGCRCIFVVRYDHDFTEEKVDLKRLCCRPTQ